MVISLKEASEQTGRTKVALLKAIKNGRLSANKNEKGQWEVDPAELFRVYEPLRKPEMEKLAVGNSKVTSELSVEVAVLRERLSALEAERERERQLLNNQVEDLQKDRDHWRQQATYLIEDQRQESDSSKGFLKRFFR